MRLDLSVTSRRALLAAAGLALTPLRAPAADAPPTYSLKGLAGAISGSDRPRPMDLGVIGRGMDGTKTGLLNPCGYKGCISSFAQASGRCAHHTPSSHRKPSMRRPSAMATDDACVRALLRWTSRRTSLR